MANGFTFTVGTVIDNTDFTVNITVAPCDTVHVRFLINGVEVDSADVGVPGSQKFHAPAGSQGKTWRIEVSCEDGTLDSQSGTVA